ncbi:MAG: hypothetical protein IT359_09500 [Gemmatimonadaceae bacterium]|nr:hypothetical protein [Gemmatimonadaceae bacterium]
MTHPHSGASPTLADSLPPELREFAQELAVAVHKRGIYPAGHPMQSGAVEGVLDRLTALLTTRPELSIGVGRSHLLLDGISTDPHNPLMCELAERLHDHLLGGVRIIAGVSRGELDDFVERLASPTSRGGEALGAPGIESVEPWSHIHVIPVAFNQLALLDGATDGEGGESLPPGSRTDLVWTALAQAALSGDGGGRGSELRSPLELAQAFEARAAAPGGRDALLEALRHALDAIEQGGSAATVLKQRVSQLIELLSEQTVAMLLDMGGDATKRQSLLHRASRVLGAQAVVDLVRVAASQDGAPISGSMLRLLQKLARGASAGKGGSRQMDHALRRVVGRLLRDWTLDDPNPETYTFVLTDLSQSGSQVARDKHRDSCEPERMLEISLDAGVISPSTEAALGRLVMREGVAATLERLLRYPPSAARDALEGRLLNEAMLREQLAADRPEVPVLSHAIDRLGLRAIDPLLQALARRSESDAEWILDLLSRLGPELLTSLATAFPTLPPRALRHLVTLFDRMDRWPDGVDPVALARHADVNVRRETIRFLLKHDRTRAQGARLGLIDADERTLRMAVSAVMRQCSPEAARILMRRFDEPELAGEMRARMVRAIASVRSSETLEWLLSQVMTTRWLSGGVRLRKSSSEVLAIIGALAQYHGDDARAKQALQLAKRSRDDAVRRAALTRADSTGMGATG